MYEGARTHKFIPRKLGPQLREVQCRHHSAYPDGAKRSFEAKVRIDTENELDYYKHGGILHYVLRSLASGS